MITLHDVIMFLVSIAISLSRVQIPNVNRCGSSRHLTRRISIKRKWINPKVFVFFFKQKTAYEIGLGIPAEPLFRSLLEVPACNVPSRSPLPALAIAPETKLGTASSGLGTLEP